MPRAPRGKTGTLGVVTQPPQPTAKVLFRVPNEDGSAEVETLWAFDLGNDQYKLDNSPFYAYSVSWQDIVYAPFDKDEERATFQRVVSKSGNRTIRIVFDSPVEKGNESDRVLQGLVSLGCSYEGASKKYISLNIPPEVELEAVRKYLIERDATWEHGDPTYTELFPHGA
jgi:hypothetical protein